LAGRLPQTIAGEVQSFSKSPMSNFSAETTKPASQSNSEARLREEMSQLKGMISQLLDSRSAENQQKWRRDFEAATQELQQVEQSLVEVSKRNKLNNAGTHSMIGGMEDLEKQVQGTVLQLATVPVELEHKLRLVSAQKQASENRLEAEKATLEHRVTTMRERMGEMRDQMFTWEERFAAESARLSADRASQTAKSERLQLELTECQQRLTHVSTERDNYHIQVSKLQEHLVQTEAAKGQLLTRAEAQKDAEMEKVRQLLSKANGREAELLSELQASRASRNGRVNEAHGEVQRVNMQLREAQETASRERDQLSRQLSKVRQELNVARAGPQSTVMADRLQQELAGLSVRIQSSGRVGGSGSMVAAMATHVHTAGQLLELVSRSGDQVLWQSDHPDHHTVQQLCESVNRLGTNQHIVNELQSQLSNLETSRQQEQDRMRTAWQNMEQQLANAHRRLLESRHVADQERRLLDERISKLEAQLHSQAAAAAAAAAAAVVEPPPPPPVEAISVYDELQIALKEAIAEQVEMAEECAKLEAEVKNNSSARAGSSVNPLLRDTLLLAS